MQPCYLLTSPEKFQALRSYGCYNMVYHFPIGGLSLAGLRKIAALFLPWDKAQTSPLADTSQEPMTDPSVNGLYGGKATDIHTSSETIPTLSKLYW